MKKRKLKPFVIPSIYALSIVALISSVFMIGRAINPEEFAESDEFEYVVESIFDKDMPVISDDDVIIRPFIDSTVTIVKSYYDYEAEESIQQNAIVFFENTYIQNSGLDYRGETPNFEIVSILEGTVIRVSDDPLLGKSIDIRHDNDMISSYQCLSEAFVEQDTKVEQGFLVGKSGECTISNELADHLHFEMFHKGMVVNPQQYFDKKIKDL